MGDEQQRNLARLYAENAEFRDAIMATVSVEDAVKVAAQYGIDAEVTDFETIRGPLTDADLEGVAGGFAAGQTVITYCWCNGS